MINHMLHATLGYFRSACGAFAIYFTRAYGDLDTLKRGTDTSMLDFLSLLLWVGFWPVSALFVQPEGTDCLLPDWLGWICAAVLVVFLVILFI